MGWGWGGSHCLLFTAHEVQPREVVLEIRLLLPHRLPPLHASLAEESLPLSGTSLLSCLICMFFSLVEPEKYSRHLWLLQRRDVVRRYLKRQWGSAIVNNYSLENAVVPL